MIARFSGLISRLSLSQLLALVVLASVAPFFVASLLMFNRMVEDERQAIRTALMVNAKTLAALVDNEISTHAAIAATLANSPALRADDIQSFLAEATAAVLFVPGSWMALSDATGQQVVNTLRPFGTPLPRHAAFDIVQKGFSTGELQVGDLHIGPVAERMTGFLEYPVFRNGKPVYSISMRLVPERFYDLIKGQFTRGEVVGIVDGNYHFVARIPDNDVRTGTPASDGWRAAMNAAPEGWAENCTLEGNMSLTAYTRTTHGWSVGIARLETDISRPYEALFRYGALLTVTFSLLSFGFAGLVARRTSQGMAGLVHIAQDLSEGTPVRAPPARFAEAATIAAGLENASAELARRASLLEQINRRSTEALEALVMQRTGELVAEIQLRNETEATLRQSQKMEMIGQLAGGIAHDFNNMLTIVLGNLDTLKRRMASVANSAALAHPLDGAMQGARSAAKLTHRLLAFSRQQPLEPALVNLNTVVAGLSDMLTRSVGEGVRIETVSGGRLWPVFADDNQLENCLVNLTVNARDAMAGHGKLTVETSNTVLDEEYARRFGDVTPGQYVMLSVTDTGVGIAPEKLEKVFEPFFTTKEPGKGTGLGLAMVHGFVKQSGGHVRIYSEVGVGTTVRIYLPRHQTNSSTDEVTPGAPLESPPPEKAAPGETILLVEDDEGVRDYAISALEDLGYVVLATASGEEALAALAVAPQINVLFTDVVLGGSMDGRQLSAQVATLRPNLPVLFTTGYTRNANVQNDHPKHGVHLLSKPYTQRELAEKIRNAIAAAQTSVLA